MRLSGLRKALLGASASIVALTTVQAADLPAKAKPIEYVKICSLYGTGFYYIPGTETCIRIAGIVRIDTAIHGGIYDTPYWQGGATGAGQYNKDYFQTRSRLNLFLDTRTATDYGVVRAVGGLAFDWTRGRENIAGGYVESDYLFVQFAGFTIGKAVSQFDPQWALAKPYIASGFLAGSNNATGINQLAYTASFGSGASATISLEDGVPYRSAGVVNTSQPFLGPFGVNISGYLLAPTYGTVANTFVGNAQTGDHVPDIVGNLRFDQAWGTAHVAVAAHEVHGTYYTPSNSDTGHPSSTWGYAVSGAFELKNLPTGVGDSLKVEATFANGAPKYVFGGAWDAYGAGRFAVANGGTMAFGYILDGVYSGTSSLNGSGISKTDSWDVSAFYEHYWTPQWRTSVFASYSHIAYGSAGNAALLVAFNGPVVTANSIAPGSKLSGNFDLNVAQIGTRTAWSPVKDLTLAAEFYYTRMDQNFTGTINVVGVPGYAGASPFVLRDQNLYNGGFQVQRSF
ncbi:porin [Bradyrhizobium prioriisuperbiae]|uniref:porin n=1 Tax=Bradyrhizobium prioriisuperbiae TaxID=2854389 RepID=UPI0028E1D825|nr:porin [Bradyrhizobium prioritasuperba]